MTNRDSDSSFAGSLPTAYATYLVPLLFEPYAADLVERLASRNPTDRVGVTFRRPARSSVPGLGGSQYLEPSRRLDQNRRNLMTQTRTQRDKTVYWLATGAVCAVMVFSAVNFNLKRPLGIAHFSVGDPLLFVIDPICLSYKRPRVALSTRSRYRNPANRACCLVDLTSSSPRRAGLLLPSLDVHTHHEEPHGQREFPEDAGDHEVGGQTLWERR